MNSPTSNRQHLIQIALVYSELYTIEQLESFSDAHLEQIKNSLFLNIKQKIEEVVKQKENYRISF